MSRYHDRILADGATHYWPLNERAGTTAADLIGGAHGAISGGVTLGVAGPADATMMRFDGTSGKVVTAGPSVVLPLVGTIEAWIKKDSATPQCPFFSARSAGASAFAPYFGAITGPAFIYTGGGANTAASLAVGVLYHIVAVLEDQQCTFYLNGALDSTRALARAACTSPSIALGWDETNLAEFWPGLIGRVAIYPLALTAAQVAAHHALGLQAQGSDWKVTIGGVDRTAIVDSFTTTGALNDRARATVVVADFMPPRFAELVSYAADGVTALFGGVILQRSLRGRTQYDATYQLTLEVGDWLTYADWAYVTKAYPEAVTLKQVLADLVAEHLAPYGITLDPAQVVGPTLAAFTWTDKRAADALRELSDRTTYVLKIDPAKRLRMFVPASLAAPVTMTEEAPNCHEVTWRDSERTPFNKVILRCGPNGAGEPVPYHWIGNAGHVYSLQGNAVPASSAWPGIVIVAGVQYPIWPPGEGPADRIEWNYALNDGTLTFIGAAFAFDTVGADIEITYSPQFPFTVTKSTGATPVVEHLEERPDVLALKVAEEIATTLLAQGQAAPREASITTEQDGFIPGQALTIILPTTRAISGTFLITSVSLTIVLDTAEGDRFWQYTLEVIESTLYQGSYLDGWREIAGVGGGSTTITGSGGGGAGGGLPALPPGALFVGDALSLPAARTITGDVTFSEVGVTTIGAGRVTGGMIADGAIASADIADGAITSGKIADGTIVNADVSLTAGIVDGKLAILSTPGKVANSATTANAAAVPDTIALRDASADLFARVLRGEACVVSASVVTPLVTSASGPLQLKSANSAIEIPSTYGLETAYVAGFAGAGFALSQNRQVANRSYLEADQLTIRGTMNVYELLIHQIRATNGSIFISSTGRVKTVTSTGGGAYTIVTETDHGFLAGDLIRAQRFTGAIGAGVYRVDAAVTGVSSSTGFTLQLDAGSPNSPAPGMDFVRLGNNANAARRGSIYLTADDPGAPYLQFQDGVASFADWTSLAKIKGRIGNLNGAYGYGADVYGAAFGDPAAAWIKIDAVNGVRIGHNATTFTHMDAAGNATYSGTVAVGNVVINQTGIRITPTTAFDWTARAYTFAVPTSSVGLAFNDSGVGDRNLGVYNLWNGAGTKRNVAIMGASGVAGYADACTVGVSTDGNPANRFVELAAGGSLIVRNGGTVEWGGGGQAIPNSDLVARRDLANTFVGPCTFSAAVDVAGRFQVGNTNPMIQTYSTQSAVDEKYTRWIAGQQNYGLQFINDAYSAAGAAMTVTRSALSLVAITRGDNLSTWTVVSDARAKTNIREVPDAVEKMRAVQIRAFDYTGDFGLPVGTGVGPLAHELRALFPNSVKTLQRARASAPIEGDAAGGESVELLALTADELWMTHIAYSQAIDARVTALEALAARLERREG